MTRKAKPAASSATPPKSAQAKAQDDQVMATNNSSIVSKRSVEKLYYANEPHFFRYFVKKFQRRAPLINRGYWLRLRAIDVLVRDFLRGARVRGKRGVVVNMGCGSDVLPWQCLTRYPEECGNARFVDVDFPDLIERKRQTVLGTPELLGMLTGLTGEKEGLVPPLVLESDRYVQIGCDLRDLATLQAGLAAAVGDFAACEFIFVAEVSITYMETEGADAVIRWASTVGNAEFVLLEQILPDGEGHPFASTMLRHFEKLNTQLKSVRTYPTVTAQHARFSSRGWASVQVWTLWQAWADEIFLSAAERRALDEIEEFDEWLEFALFASHYCVVHARAGSTCTPLPAPSLPSDVSIPIQPAALHFDECSGTRGQRRFAAAVPFLDGTKPSVLNVLGLGTKSRLQSCDVFSLGGPDGVESLTFGDGGPTTRMCHSLTDLGNNAVLLAGGRSSPSRPLGDCWVLDKGLNVWKQTHDHPVPLYRHAVSALGDSGLALLVGGRGEDEALDGCLVYRPETGWLNCEIIGHRPAAVYGAAISCEDSPRGSATFRGLYIGGIHNGLISDQALAWEADISNPMKPTIEFTLLKLAENGDIDTSRWLLARFGATCLQHGDEFLILGGVASDHLLSHRDEVLLCSVSDNELTITRRLFGQGTERGSMNRPLFVGHSAVPMPDGSVVVVGGGATCFSMGTFWNKGVYTFRPQARGTQAAGIAASFHRWVHARTIDILPAIPSPAVPSEHPVAGKLASITDIPRVKLETAADFLEIVRKGRPVVLEGLDLGGCVSAWTLDYLVDRIGADRKVVIHDAATKAMDFTSRNFRYVTTGFGDFAGRVKQGDRLYLRALSHEKPSEKPAVLADDFPALASDFVLPAQLSLVTENLFSSVLRVSGPVNMWLHYDVMANVYCQIGGSKRLVLFPPSDVEYLSFAPGASSSSVDVFSSLGSPKLARSRPHEAVLSPGDVLVLPPLWLHTATPVSDESIAVNVFFRDLDGGHYAPGRDVYGNRDLASYEKARQDVARIAGSFRKMPDEARAFYILKLADELRGLARG
ncbi:LCM-domain-containing protein [Parathielavia hyrcaniae]|uniref:tRNA wybutosine-synthesizing protein 4 n=1 Tax=Parathielavia hyrcaniae TaxID=113614 RepID=A0AAN6Q4R9_9PEZI|nr:LCM-domain-containing protein [Parathielavia hyrcaniae]